MYSSKLSVSIHILSLVALKPQDAITSDWIAGSIRTNPALVRRLLSRLKRAGLVRTRTGVGVTSLAKSAQDISLLQVFRAVETERHLFDIHSGTNLNCPVGAKIEEVLAGTYAELQKDFERRLADIRLSDLLSLFQFGDEAAADCGEYFTPG